MIYCHGNRPNSKIKNYHLEIEHNDIPYEVDFLDEERIRKIVVSMSKKYHQDRKIEPKLKLLVISACYSS
jgi:hypothetical protein